MRKEEKEKGTREKGEEEEKDERESVEKKYATWKKNIDWWKIEEDKISQKIILFKNNFLGTKMMSTFFL